MPVAAFQPTSRLGVTLQQYNHGCINGFANEQLNMEIIG
jgi:hypothetical protein